MSNNLYYNTGCSCTQFETCSNCEVDSGCLYPSNTDCVTYDKNDLPNIGVPIAPETVAKLTDIIKAIDTKLGSIIGNNDNDYPSYNTYCLAPITTQKEFVEKISNEFCTLQTAYNLFSGTTYPAAIGDLQSQVTALKLPNLTSSGCVNVLITDTSSQIDQKLITQVESICTNISLSSVVWNTCFTVSSTPTTVAQGFNQVLAQICQLQSQIVTASGDTYKIKTTSADTNPDYLDNKLVVTPCLSKTIITTGGQDQIQLGLSYTPEVYTFNTDHFDVTDTGVTTCTRNYNISLKAGFITPYVSSVNISSDDMDISGAPITNSGTINLSLKDINSNVGTFNNVTINAKGLVTAASNVTYVQTELDPTVPTWVKAITQTDINNWNSGSSYTLPTASTTVKGGIIVGDGLKITGDTLSTIYSAGSGISIDPTGIISNTSPNVPSNLSLAAPTTSQQTIQNSFGTGVILNSATTSAAGLMSATDKFKLDGLSNYTLPVASTTILGGIKVGTGLQMIGDTLNVTSGSNSCWDNVYNSPTLLIPASGDDGTPDLTFIYSGTSDQVDPKITGTQESIVNLQYKFDLEGNYVLRGNISLEYSTSSTTGSNSLYFPLIDLSPVSSCYDSIVPITKNIGSYCIQGVDGLTFVNAYIHFNPTTDRLELLLKVVWGQLLMSISNTISLDGVIIPLQGNVPV